MSGQDMRKLMESLETLSEANPDGTYSDGEQEEFAEYLHHLQNELNTLALEGIQKCVEMGGQFRSPSYISQLKKQFKMMENWIEWTYKKDFK